MTTVTNKTQRPLGIPLPGGKTLHLGPRGVGQIAANAAAYAPVKKLVDAGEIEITDERPAQSGTSGRGRKSGAGPAGFASGAGGRRSGDR